MGKTFRLYKNFRKSHGMRRKLTFGDYKKVMHLKQKMEKRTRKNYLKVKSMLSQGRKYVVAGTLYYWGKDNKSIITLKPDFDMTRRVFEMIKKEKENG